MNMTEKNHRARLLFILCHTEECFARGVGTCSHCARPFCLNCFHEHAVALAAQPDRSLFPD